MTWDPRVPKEIDEAKLRYREAKAKGHQFLSEDDKPLDHFPALIGFVKILPQSKVGQCFFRVLDETGDRRLTWDSTDPDQIEEAAKKFDGYMKKGYRAYAVSLADPKVRGPRIYGFDPKTEEVLFDDSGSVREKLAGFISKFQEVTLLPKTTPG